MHLDNIEQLDPATASREALVSALTALAMSWDDDRAQVQDMNAHPLYCAVTAALLERFGEQHWIARAPGNLGLYFALTA